MQSPILRFGDPVLCLEQVVSLKYPLKIEIVMRCRERKS